MVVLGEGTLWHLQKFLQCIKYIKLEFTCSTSLLHPSPLRFIFSHQILRALCIVWVLMTKWYSTITALVYYIKNSIGSSLPPE
jgi:hypothetical protein